LVPQSYILGRIYGAQVAWFADESGRIIGTTARSERNRRWFYIVLERETDGHYQVSKVQSGFQSQQVASGQLTLAMKSAVNAKLCATR
jgi:hypothetical protein